MHERNESAAEVRPEHSGPTNSLMAPIGRPPFNKSSSVSMPVAATGRIILGAGVRADGIFRARTDSICRRTAEADGIHTINMFALSSPNPLAGCQMAFCLIFEAHNTKSISYRTAMT